MRRCFFLILLNYFFLIFKNCPVFRIKRGRLPSFHYFSYLSYNLNTNSPCHWVRRTAWWRPSWQWQPWLTDPRTGEWPRVSWSCGSTGHFFPRVSVCLRASVRHRLLFADLFCVSINYWFCSILLIGINWIFSGEISVIKLL